VRVHLAVDVQADATWGRRQRPDPGRRRVARHRPRRRDQIATGSEKTDERGWLA